MPWIDHRIGDILAPLAVWILISGLDDLVLDMAWIYSLVARAWYGGSGIDEPGASELSEAPQKRIAIFVPLWHEADVIARMVENNLLHIKYSNYDFFLGGYPNDGPTLEAIRDLEARFGNVHVAVCPHNGPTSKADCLNSIYQRMLEFERAGGARYDIVVTHDAEDVIHPLSLERINYYSDVHDMVQIPVLPLATPFRSFTHGLYCDEFAEYQTKDMPARHILGGFIPSNGVGTGYTRYALDQLAATGTGIFDPVCLTEDYENGYRLHLLGCPQHFVPIAIDKGAPIATREFFPRRFRHAVKQRTRWVTGIALQTWQRHGWSGGFRQAYWLWRDRKGLIGNPVSMFTSAIFLYGLATFLWSQFRGLRWGLGRFTHAPIVLWLMCVNLSLQGMRMGVRAVCVARIYGWAFASGVVLRAIYGNLINFCATASAIVRYAKARLLRRPLVWLKTEHSYPTLAAASGPRRRLGEILVASGQLSRRELARALSSKPVKVRLGEHLLASGRISEQQLYQALSAQQGVPLGYLDPQRIERNVARALPAQLVHRWSVLPFRISSGRLFVAGSELPSDEMRRDLELYTRLDLCFQLITPSNFDLLRKALL
jgi:bacteriophage N4 adsorption protein B